MSHEQESLRVNYLNLGCRVNRVELDSIASELEDAGFVTSSLEDADVVVVNTCAVTGEAEAKTRKAIRRAASMPASPKVFATGCVCNLFTDEIASLGENVYIETDKSQVAHRIIDEFGVKALSCSEYSLALGELTPTGRTRPGIKIQDGCDNRCSYCIVWKARGKARSLEPKRVLEQVRALERTGAKEVVLTGINLANWSYDEDGASWDFARLLDELLEKTSIQRFRLSSIEPPETTDRLLDVIGQSEGRVAEFLHLALQSGCNKTLREMCRHYDTALYERVVDHARERIDNLALGCDLIVGFPGETDADFEESMAFCAKMNFAKMHVFRYSLRPGTPAAERDDQVPSEVKTGRARTARFLASHMRQDNARQLIGTRQNILVQGPGTGVTGGLFNCMVDDSIEANTFVKATIESAKNDTLIASNKDDLQIL